MKAALIHSGVNQRTFWALLGLALAGTAQAAGLPALIREATGSDPAILEARANAAVAASRLAATRAQRYPVLGVSAGSTVVGSAYYGAPFRGVTGRVNVFDAGSVSAAVERDERREQALHLRTDETRENVAMSVTDLFLQALRGKEMMDIEQLNLKRHEKIVGDLRIIVANDGGRRYELVQAESRALQVRMRIVQHEKTMRLALSKLTRFTRQSPTLVNPIPDNWRAVLPANIDERLHPALEAQQREVQVTRADQTALERGRWPRLDIEAGAGNHSYARLVTNWSFFDRAADYNVQTAAKQISAAQQRAELLERDLAQRAATAEADMAQSQFQIKAAEAQIGSSTQVVELYELQFKVGRRSLIELVNAYAELSATELSRTVALNDYRTAVASYLYARAALADWALAQAPQTQVASEARP